MLDYHCTGIQKMILDRLVQIHEEIVGVDPEYRQLGERPDELLKQLTAKLNHEDQSLLDEYDSACTTRSCRQDELIYNEGLMDGISLGYWVTLVGRGVEKIRV